MVVHLVSRERGAGGQNSCSMPPRMDGEHSDRCHATRNGGPISAGQFGHLDKAVRARADGSHAKARRRKAEKSFRNEAASAFRSCLTFGELRPYDCNIGAGDAENEDLLLSGG
jgi:hypothetical protein